MKESNSVQVRISTKNFRKLEAFCKDRPAFSLKGVMDEAIENWMNDVAPVMLSTLRRNSTKKPAKLSA